MSLDLVPSGDGFRAGLGWWSFAAFLVAGVGWYLVNEAIKTQRVTDVAALDEKREPSLDQDAFGPISSSPAPEPSLDSPATSPL